MYHLILTNQPRGIHAQRKACRTLAFALAKWTTKEIFVQSKEAAGCRILKSKTKALQEATCAFECSCVEIEGKLELFTLSKN